MINIFDSGNFAFSQSLKMIEWLKMATPVIVIATVIVMKRPALLIENIYISFWQSCLLTVLHFLNESQTLKHASNIRPLTGWLSIAWRCLLKQGIAESSMAHTFQIRKRFTAWIFLQGIFIRGKMHQVRKWTIHKNLVIIDFSTIFKNNQHIA